MIATIVKTDEEILLEARDRDYSNTPGLHELAPKNLPTVTVSDLLMPQDSLSPISLIDVRSEAEYLESHIPGAVNFPILNNGERREVGLLYKQFSQTAAVQRALDFAQPKLESLLQFAKSQKHQPVIYCWRGGGRSAYCTRILLESGLPVLRLAGGHKAYRKQVHRRLYEEPFPQVIILKGMTGVGKSRVLEALLGRLPVLHLEDYAKNTASSFGRIPYILKGNFSDVSQKWFEDQIHEAAFSHDFSPELPLITESESQRIGNCRLPPSLFNRMREAKTIELVCSLKTRVERIFADYIGDDLRGVPLLSECLKSLARYVSKEQMAKWQSFIEKAQYHELLESLLTDYYDLRYSRFYQAEELLVSTEDIEACAQEIEDFVREN